MLSPCGFFCRKLCTKQSVQYGTLFLQVVSIDNFFIGIPAESLTLQGSFKMKVDFLLHAPDL